MKRNLGCSTLSILTLFVFILSACAPSSAAPAGNVPADSAEQAQSVPVEFTGTIQAINGSQWTVNGQQMIVEPQALDEAQAFQVGDTVRIKGAVARDGIITVSRVESPQAASAPAAASTAGPSAPTEVPSVADPAAALVPTGQQELVGVIEAINGDQITISSVTYFLAPGIEFPSSLMVGDTVKIHFTINGDGTATITEFQTTTSNFGSGTGSSDDYSGSDDDSNDDDGSDD